jgi:hypothetical protein
MAAESRMEAQTGKLPARAGSVNPADTVGYSLTVRPGAGRCRSGQQLIGDIIIAGDET